MTDFLHKLGAHTFKTGCQPYGRVGHRAILKGSNILVFGGTNFHNEVVTEILNINCESYQVSLVSTKNIVPIQNFSLHEFQNKIFLWGGKRTSGGNTYVSNELWKLQNGLFTKVTQTGSIPPARMCQSSVIFAQKHMVIYGGLSDTQIFNDWYSLNLETFQWQKIISNFVMPFNLQVKTVWLDTRGILLVSQVWSEKTSKIQYCCDVYEFMIRKRQNSLYVQLQKVQIVFKSPMIYRAFPTVCKYKGDALCLAIIGGQKFCEDDFNWGPQMFSDCWFLNLETFECSKAQDVHLTSKYHHQAVFYKDRILLIGGVCSTNEFSSFLETIDFKLKFISIDRKLCQSCKCIYGLEDFTKPKFSIKCEYESSPKSYIPAKLVKKFAEVIKNPIKAFGLLIDNSLNMNANMIEINLRKIRLDSRIHKTQFQTILELTDNSYGFTKDEIIESLFTFGYKIETCTHDSKFQEELAVRKQYGLNLKLAAMRLGKSCLITINTIQEEKFIGYFSIDPTSCPQFKDRFNCFYYFINDKNVSSQINRHIIKKNVEHLIDLEQIQAFKSTTTNNKIFVFDFNYKGELVCQQEKNISLQESDEQASIFDNLRSYLKHLYLKPYVGRRVHLLDECIDCEYMVDKLKKQQAQGKIKKIDLLKYPEQTQCFETICLYDVLEKGHENKKIIIYSDNRLITSLDFSCEMLCGVIDLKSDVEISVGKCSIESRIQEKQLKKFVLSLKDQAKLKRNYSNIKSQQDNETKALSKPNKKRK